MNTFVSEAFQVKCKCHQMIKSFFKCFWGILYYHPYQIIFLFPSVNYVTLNPSKRPEITPFMNQQRHHQHHPSLNSNLFKLNFCTKNSFFNIFQNRNKNTLSPLHVKTWVFSMTPEMIDWLFINSIRDQSVSIIDYRAIKKYIWLEMRNRKHFFT